MTDAVKPALAAGIAPAASPATALRRAIDQSGREAEARAARLLDRAGFAILAMRVRTKAGEIDLIARRADLLVFCEVKLRATLDGAAFAVTERQRRRICAAAEIFLADHPELDALDMRFDAVLVSRDGRTIHLEGAFEAEG